MRGRRWGVGIGIAVLLAVVGIRGWGWYRDRYVPHEAYTRAQILSLSKTLFAAIAGTERDLTLSAVRAGTRLNECMRPLWIVYCESPEVGLAAYAVIDGEMGETIAITDTLREVAGRKMQALTKDQALNAARSWMKDLGVAVTAKRWRLAAGPERTPTGWTFVWRAGWRTARVVVDARTGGLISANINRPGV